MLSVLYRNKNALIYQMNISKLLAKSVSYDTSSLKPQPTRGLKRSMSEKSEKSERSKRSEESVPRSIARSVRSAPRSVRSVRSAPRSIRSVRSAPRSVRSVRSVRSAPRSVRSVMPQISETPERSKKSEGSHMSEERSEMSMRSASTVKQSPKQMMDIISPTSRHIGSFIKDIDMSPNRRAKYKEFIKRIRANKVKEFVKHNIIKKYYTHEKRIKYFNYITKFLKSLDENVCLVPKRIINDNGEDIFNGFSIHDMIYLDKQIGSDSVYGVIFQTFIKNALGGVPIATKLMKVNKKNLKEIKINNNITTQLQHNRLSRHFLFSYKSFQCMQNKNIFTTTNNLSGILNSDYYMCLNEMAHGDLKMLVTDIKILRDEDLLLNLACQCMIAIASFHKLGYIHKDCHWGNFLYHKTNDFGGYYHYIINGEDYFLPAYGYTVMIYDFGMAESKQDIKNSFRKPGQADNYFIEKSIDDYTRIMKAFMNKQNGGWSIYKLLPNDIVTDVMKELREYLKSTKYINESNIINDILDIFNKSGVINRTIQRRTKIINSTPFVI